MNTSTPSKNPTYERSKVGYFHVAKPLQRHGKVSQYSIEYMSNGVNDVAIVPAFMIEESDQWKVVPIKTQYTLMRNPLDLLDEFWQRSSDACPLEATEHEKQLDEWRTWIKGIGFGSQEI